MSHIHVIFLGPSAFDDWTAETGVSAVLCNPVTTLSITCNGVRLSPVGAPVASSRCEYKDGDGAVSSLGILDKIARLKIRVDAAEDLLEATAEALRQTGVEVHTVV